MKSGALVSNCEDAVVAGNTFDYQVGARLLMVTNSTDVLVRDNIVLNNGTDAAFLLGGSETTNSQYNCFFPSNANCRIEVNSIYSDPQVNTNGDYEITAYASPVRNTGTPVSGMVGDVFGKYRHLTVPCRGAVEYLCETITPDVAGRIAQRNQGGRVENFGYNALGQLTDYTNVQDSTKNATYKYDPFGRRILSTVGSSTTRYIYQGQDVVAEYASNDGGISVARKRVYWLLPELDQRIGFVEISNGVSTVYYYLSDQVGSVMQIVDSSGTVVNQYDYDAWGNVRWDSPLTFTNVENRYLFQGREYDRNSGTYYFRMRQYVPEWGSFMGPDMNLSRGIEGEPNGVGSYVAFGNNPLRFKDGMGLAPFSYQYGGGEGFNVSMPAEDVLPIVNQVFSANSGLPPASTILPAFDWNETHAPQMLGRPEVDCDFQAGLAFAYLQNLDAMRSEVDDWQSFLNANDPLFASLYQRLDSEEDATATSLEEYLNYAGYLANNKIENTGSQLVEGLTDAKREIRNRARVAEYEGAHPVVGLQSPDVDPVDLFVWWKVAGIAGFGIGVQTFENQGGKFLFENWHKATFPNRLLSIKHHLAKHGNGRQAVQYTQDAMAFFAKNKHLGEKVILKDGVSGIKIQTKVLLPNGKTKNVGGYWTESGKLVTFWD